MVMAIPTCCRTGNFFVLSLNTDCECIHCELLLVPGECHRSSLIRIEHWFRMAPSHYLSQCLPRFMSQHGITWPHWVKKIYLSYCMALITCYFYIIFCPKRKVWHKLYVYTYHYIFAFIWHKSCLYTYHYTVECCYNMVQYNMIIHTSLQELLRQNINHRRNPQKTPHTSPWRVSYGVSFINFLEKIENTPLYMGQVTVNW